MGPTRTVRSSLEERDTLLSSLSLELWQHEKEEGHEWQVVGFSRHLQTLPYSTADQMSAQSDEHTATNPAGHYTVIVVVAVPLRIKHTSEKHWRHFCICAFTGWAFTYVSVFVLMFLLFLWLLMWVWGGVLTVRGREGGQWRVKTRYLDQSYPKTTMHTVNPCEKWYIQ